jgi:hypothetical protein
VVALSSVDEVSVARISGVVRGALSSELAVDEEASSRAMTVVEDEEAAEGEGLATGTTNRSGIGTRLSKSDRIGPCWRRLTFLVWGSSVSTRPMAKISIPMVSSITTTARTTSSQAPKRQKRD